MTALLNWLSAHWGAIATTFYLIAAAAINALPIPSSTSSAVYGFWYRFLNALPIPSITSTAHVRASDPPVKP